MGSPPTPISANDASSVALEAWLVTDVGVVRDHNEDSATMELKDGFFIVADGMGGHAAGEIASAMAVETVKATLQTAQDDIDAFKEAPSDAGRRTIVQLLQHAVLQAHQAVYQRGQAEPDKQGMGTTLDVVLVAGAEAFVAHVGDSRTYLVRDGRSSQITTDHTVAEVLVIEGKLSIEEAQVSPLRTILVNAIGVSADVGVEMAHVALKRDDRLLVCSDGLHDYFPADEEIAQLLSVDAPGKALKEMVELAKARGGHDNITGIAIHVVELTERTAAIGEGDSTEPLNVNSDLMTDEPTQSESIPEQVAESGAAGSSRPAPDRSSSKGDAAQPNGTEDGEIGFAATLPPPVSGRESANHEEERRGPRDAPHRPSSPTVESIGTADTGPTAAKQGS